MAKRRRNQRRAASKNVSKIQTPQLADFSLEKESEIDAGDARAKRRKLSPEIGTTTSRAGSSTAEAMVAPQVTNEDAASVPGETSDLDPGKLEGAPPTVDLPPVESQEQCTGGVKNQQVKATQRQKGRDEEGLDARQRELVANYPSPSPTVGLDSQGVRAQDASNGQEVFSNEHETLLKAGLNVARQNALTITPTTPDDQLRLEEEQAVEARRTASMSGPPKDEMPTKEAENVVDEITEVREESGRLHTPGPRLAATDIQSPISQIGDTVTTTREEMTQNRGQPLEISPPDSTDTSPDKKISSSKKRLSVDESEESEEGKPKRKKARFQGPNSRTSHEKSLDSSPPGSNPRKQSSTVVFASKSGLLDGHHTAQTTYQALKGASIDKSRDYLQTLFSHKAFERCKSLSLRDLLSSANKTISTANYSARTHEEQDCRILQRIYELQNANRWSYRQIERCPEPTRPLSHWDVLLDHAKWMAVDFREERKWKIVLAKKVADWCAEWVTADEQTRSALRIKVAKGQSLSAHFSPDAGAVESTGSFVQSTDGQPRDPASYAEQHFLDRSQQRSDDYLVSEVRTVSPAAIFSLTPLEVSFTIQKTHASDSLLDELPIYKPASIEELHSVNKKPNESPLVPVTRYIGSKIVPKPPRNPQKRSRFEYEHEADNDREPALEPEATDVALFDPENQKQRDRIYSAQRFRPPPASEFGMPLQKFYESRGASLWTIEDDDELRRLVKDYSFNWPLISACLSPSSSFISVAERRTPWECFERWVGLEGGLPGDMAKHTFFKTWTTRMEAAKRNVQARQHAMQQHQAAQAGEGQQNAAASLRFKPNSPYRVDRRRNTRHIYVIDAMRKLARKREQVKHKQDESAKAAALRKAHEHAQPKTNHYTPQQWSQMKADRQQKIDEQRAIFRQAQQQRVSLHPCLSITSQNADTRVQAQQAAMGQRHPHQPGQSETGPPNSSSGASAGTSLPHSQMQQGSQRIQALPPNIAGVGNLQSNLPGNSRLAVPGMPQAQMQANGAGNIANPQQQQQQRTGAPQMSPESLRMLLEANRQNMTQQQMQAQHTQQRSTHYAGQQRPSPNHLPQTQHRAPSYGGMHPPSMVSSLQHGSTNGHQTPPPSMNGTSHSNQKSASPHQAFAQAHVQTASHPQQYPSQYSNSHSHPQTLSSGHVPTIAKIASQIQAQQPHLSPEQVQKMAAERLAQQTQTQSYNMASYQQQRQNALNAAAGVSSPSPNLQHAIPNTYPRLSNEGVVGANGLVGGPSSGAGNGTTGNNGSRGEGSPEHKYRTQIAQQTMMQQRQHQMQGQGQVHMQRSNSSNPYPGAVPGQRPDNVQNTHGTGPGNGQRSSSRPGSQTPQTGVQRIGSHGPVVQSQSPGPGQR